MTLIDKACFERGCACYDSRDKGECVEVVEKRTWVGLTDEDIDKTYETQVWEARRSYARAIEAKLKEKNNA
jgi:hypothetical protein